MVNNVIFIFKLIFLICAILSIINVISILFGMGIAKITKERDGCIDSSISLVLYFLTFVFFAGGYTFLSMPDKNPDKVVEAKEKEPTNDKFDFIEREFKRQVKYQLKDSNIILFLDDFYSGEYEERFIEKIGNESGLALKNVLFYNKKVIYEFVHKKNN